jgi:hypothetical protein
MKDISLHILDIVHNSIRAKAGFVEILIVENIVNDLFQIEVRDNGRGIAPEMLPSVADPFTTSRKTRKVGMGLALLQQNAQQAGGDLVVESEIGKGTRIIATFQHHHIDRPPLGDIAGVMVQLVNAFQEIDFIYSHSADAGNYIFDTREVRMALDGTLPNQPEIRKFLIEMINDNLNAIGVWG